MCVYTSKAPGICFCSLTLLHGDIHIVGTVFICLASNNESRSVVELSEIPRTALGCQKS